MPDKTYTVSVNSAVCKQCGICVNFCPREVLASDENGDVNIISPEACTGCLMCELLCPEVCINIDIQE
jgi:2-oxoglutarate ferredoxin oxidoreductase subunit delta